MSRCGNHCVLPFLSYLSIELTYYPIRGIENFQVQPEEMCYVQISPSLGIML